MSYKSILVYLDDLSQAKSTLDMASEVSEQHQAHLTGVYVVPPLELYTSVDFPIPQDARDGHRQLHLHRSDEIKALFEQQTNNRNFVSEWRFVDSNKQPVESAISTLSNAFDLLIVGQRDESTGSARQRNMPEQIMLNCARPTLLVPPDYAASRPIRDVLVAFDHSARASRAIFDSLPLLQMADTVTLHRINPKAGEQTFVLDNGDEIVTTLARHGVNAELVYTAVSQEVFAAKDAVGDEFLQIAGEKGADVLIMGAYSHSRLGQQLFGGTTRAVLQKMKLPVLMSH